MKVGPSTFRKRLPFGLAAISLYALSLASVYQSVERDEGRWLAWAFALFLAGEVVFYLGKRRCGL